MLGRERGASAQATGEEYGLRGLVSGWRAAGARTAHLARPRIGVTAVVFAAFHIAADPWLYLWYFVFAISTV